MLVLIGRGMPLSEHELLFRLAKQAARRCNVWVSHYEELVSYPQSWAARFMEAVGFGENATQADAFRRRFREWAQQEERLAQQRERPNQKKHAAYVRPGQFLSLLRPPTIVEMLQNLSKSEVLLSGYF